MKPVAIGLVLIGASAAAADVIRGEAVVRDAVTLAIAGGRIRLEGIIVPEGRSCGAGTCADAAMDVLTALTAGHAVVCTPSHKLGHGFSLGRCALEGGPDLGRHLLSEGLAALGEGFSTQDQAAVAQAQGAKKGMWGE